jgi:hypothetical protein
MLDRLIRWTKVLGAKPDRSFLKHQVATMLSTFAAIRGWSVLLSNQTATVLRRDFETFVTAGLNGIEHLETVLAVVYIKDLECYEEIKEIQSDNVLRTSALAASAFDQLADQITEAMLGQIAKDGKQKPLGGSPVFQLVQNKDLPS